MLAEVESWRDGLPAGTIILPFGHVGDGNLHVNFVVPEDQVEAVREPLLERLYDTVDRLQGSISAEHGVGRAKLAAVWARKSAAFRDLSIKIKQTLDPENRLNPGVVVPGPADDQ